MSEPLAWRYSFNETSWDATTNGSYARSLLDEGYTVTPLVAAPPEDGRPSYRELECALRGAVEMLSDFARTAREMGWKADASVVGGFVEGADALLARIPKEEG